MKYMFISDIHGDLDVFNRCIDIFKTGNANKLILLGDTCSRHGLQGK